MASSSFSPMRRSRTSSAPALESNRQAPLSCTIGIGSGQSVAPTESVGAGFRRKVRGALAVLHRVLGDHELLAVAPQDLHQRRLIESLGSIHEGCGSFLRGF